MSRRTDDLSDYDLPGLDLTDDQKAEVEAVRQQLPGYISRPDFIGAIVGRTYGERLFGVTEKNDHADD